MLLKKVSFQNSLVFKKIIKSKNISKTKLEQPSSGRLDSGSKVAIAMA